MEDKKKAEQRAIEIANRTISSYSDVIVQCLLKKNYEAAKLHLKSLQTAVNDLGKNIQILDK